MFAKFLSIGVVCVGSKIKIDRIIRFVMNCKT